VWFLKVYKIFEKKFERVRFEFEKKSCFKKEFEKKKKGKPYLLTFRPKQPSSPPSFSPRRPTSPLSFSFSLLSLTPGPHSSVSPSPPSFLLLLCLAALSPQPRIPPRPASFPSFPSSSSFPIKAINHPRSSGAVSLSFAPSRDGRGHQWQAPPLGAPSPSLALLPVLLFKPVLERLRLPLPSQRTHSHARAPIHQRRRLGFPPSPPCNRRRR
jgi:hypothetical protein